MSALLVWWMNVSAAMLLTARTQPLKEMKQCSTHCNTKLELMGMAVACHCHMQLHWTQTHVNG